MTKRSERSKRPPNSSQPRKGARGEPYIPALRFSRLTSLYDPLVAWTAREDTFKRRLVREAHIQPGHSVLDLGCGTATLTILIKRRQPKAEVTGVDGDDQVLAIARRKVAESGLEVSLDPGLAGELSYPPGSFDRVLSSLLFHHLNRDQKKAALGEVMRVLKPGGELHVADWGQARNVLQRAAFLSVQLLDGFETTTDNARGRLPQMIKKAGFIEVSEYARYLTVFGVVSLYRAVKAE